MENYCTPGQAADYNTVWRMRIAYWKPTAINAHSEYVIITDFPLQQWLQIRASLLRALYTLSVKLSDFAVWRHTWRKNWVNRAVLTGNSAGLRTIISSGLSHRELRSSLRESHTHSVQFFVQFFTQFNLECVGSFTQFFLSCWNTNSLWISHSN